VDFVKQSAKNKHDSESNQQRLMADGLKTAFQSKHNQPTKGD
jgi:hypothetical protein